MKLTYKVFSIYTSLSSIFFPSNIIFTFLQHDCIKPTSELEKGCKLLCSCYKPSLLFTASAIHSRLSVGIHCGDQPTTENELSLRRRRNVIPLIQHGSQSFCVASTTVWNSLPNHVHADDITGSCEKFPQIDISCG